MGFSIAREDDLGSLEDKWHRNVSAVTFVVVSRISLQASRSDAVVRRRAWLSLSV